VLIAVTADHGAAPVPEEMKAAGFDAGRAVLDDLVRQLPALLERRFPAVGVAPPAWKVQAEEYQVYVNQPAIRARGLDPAEVERVIADAILYDDAGRRREGVFAAYTRHEILNGRLPRTEVADLVQQSYSAERSGEVIVVPDPNWLLARRAPAYATTHGTPFIYDRHVPILLRGPGVAAGVYVGGVSPADIAPTLSTILGIPFPSGCVGRPIGLGRP